jgi:RNA polymerase sigma factor (sigma-70 family)
MSVEKSDNSGSLTQEAAQEDERLVRAIQNGDPEAEREFAVRFLRPVRSMLLARSRDPDLTADLRQDVMMKAIVALRRGQLRDPGKLSAFVIAITRNVLNNHYRGASRRPESLELPDNLPDLSVGADQVEEQERASSAMSAIASLEPLDKEILQMTLVDGLKPGVIALRLQMTSDVVRQRKLRATRKVMDFIRGRSQKDSSGHIIVGKVT